MRLESYLLIIAFENPILVSELKSLLINCGASPVDAALETNFEIRDIRGLTELQVGVGNSQQVRQFSLRFSILSPHTVIDQAFELLEKLSNLRKIKVFDTQLKVTQIPIDVGQFRRNRKNVKKRQTIIDNETGLIIEGGFATTEYIHKNNLLTLYKSD